MQQDKENGEKSPEDLDASKVENSAFGYPALSLKYAAKMGSHTLWPLSTFYMSGLYQYAKCKAPSDELVYLILGV